MRFISRKNCSYFKCGVSKQTMGRSKVLTCVFRSVEGGLPVRLRITFVISGDAVP